MSASWQDTALSSSLKAAAADTTDSISHAGSQPRISTDVLDSQDEHDAQSDRSDYTSSASSDNEDAEEAPSISMPAHKLVLMAKSGYFDLRLRTALGNKPSSVIEEHASDLEELRAMEAVIEFMYTDKLPLYCSNCWKSESDTRADFGQPSQTQRLLRTLTVADRWYVRPCFSACCTAICAQLPLTLTWEDCISILNVPEGLQERPELTSVMNFALDRVITLVNNTRTTSPETHQDVLSSKLHHLPKSARLDLLKTSKLFYTGMMVLLSSDEQVADSEDSLATILYKYLKTEVGEMCTNVEMDALIDQLRYQHMSSAFVAFALPGMEPLCLNTQHLLQLMYLRGLKNVASIPERFRQLSVPASWYRSPRKQVGPFIIEIKLKISEKDLSDHLTALVLLKEGGVAPSALTSYSARHNGISWSMLLMSSSKEQQLQLVVQPTSITYDHSALQQVGVFVDVTYKMHGVARSLSGTRSGWTGVGGIVVKSFMPQKAEMNGDATVLNWWKDFIVHEEVCITATVIVQS